MHVFKAYLYFFKRLNVCLYCTFYELLWFQREYYTYELSYFQSTLGYFWYSLLKLVSD